MRRLILVLMIALLPLRAWVGDAMALGMLVEQPPVLQHIAAADDYPSASGVSDAQMQAECHDHAHASAASDDTRQTHCGSCPLCQICHGVAAPAPCAVLPAGWLTHALPSVAHAPYASATTAFALKPPIS